MCTCLPCIECNLRLLGHALIHIGMDGVSATCSHHAAIYNSTFCINSQLALADQLGRHICLVSLATLAMIVNEQQMLKHTAGYSDGKMLSVGTPCSCIMFTGHFDKLQLCVHACRQCKHTYIMSTSRTLKASRSFSSQVAQASLTGMT